MNKELIKICKRCKTKANRIIIIKRKVVRLKREFEEMITVEKEYSCECGRATTSGDIPSELIDKEHPRIITE